MTNESKLISDSEKTIDDAWQQFINGSKEAFVVLYKTYHSYLTIYCLKMTKSIASAEDIASETLVKLFEHPHPEEINNISRWLFTVAKNSCINSHLLNKRRQTILSLSTIDIASDSMAHAPDYLQAEIIEKIMEENLTASEKLIWQMHIEGFSNEQIGKALQIPFKTVANKKSNIRNLLRKKLSKV